MEAAFDSQEIEAVIERVRLKLGSQPEAAPPPIRTETAVGDGVYPTIDAAVTAARAAFEAYRLMGLKNRYRIIDSVRAAMRDSAVELARLALDVEKEWQDAVNLEFIWRSGQQPTLVQVRSAPRTK